ncbi:hypothetical protein THIOSC13_1350078 [uncultured Thiomicrorhabdus sp.]
MQLEQPIRFMGMLLLNPNLYLNTPEPGKKAEFSAAGGKCQSTDFYCAG